MLEQHVVLVGSSADTSKDSTAHELIDIRTKAVNDLCTC